MTTYRVCLLLIKRGRVTAFKEKLDVYLAADRLSVEQYGELISLLG